MKTFIKKTRFLYFLILSNLVVFLVPKVNKRDLEEEQRIRDEKRKERKAKGGGPPIMNRDGF